MATKPKAKPKEHKLDIFGALNAIDTRDADWLGRQGADAQKEFKPRVVIRWLTTVPDGDVGEFYLRTVNERVNIDLDSIAREHPGLVFRLMASCGLGMSQRHGWTDMPRRRARGGKARALLERFMPAANDLEIDIVLNGFGPGEFEDFVEQSGLPPEEIKEVLQAYARFNGEAAGTSV